MTIEKRTKFLSLWNPVCGSANALWHGSTLEAAAQEWQRLVARRPDEEFDLTAYGAGEVASHREMAWRYGTPKASFACPICDQDTPHQHAGEAIARHRQLESWKQREMEKRWERIEARIAELAALNAPDAEPPRQEPPVTKDDYLRKLMDAINERDPGRWEVGFRNIVNILVGPRQKFEIAEIVGQVRALHDAARLALEVLEQAGMQRGNTAKEYDAIAALHAALSTHQKDGGQQG